MREKMLQKMKERSASEQWKSAKHFQRGSAHPKYKPNSGKRQRMIEYQRYEYRAWRKAVYERDNYTCQKCGAKGAYLNAHHIKPWADYPEFRYDLDNGIALCRACHIKEHHP
jgi:5-methylcytosine-specific restriction endonuclease McrA